MMGIRRGWAVVTVAATLIVAGCGGSGGSKAAHPIGDPAIRAVRVVAQADTPLDAAPSPDGTDIFYLATADNGPAVYRVPAGGGPASVVTQGTPLTKPTGIGIAPDGQRLYLADQQAKSAALPGAVGAILTVSALGTPEPLTTLPGTRGRAPRGLDVGSDVIYFTGTDPANSEPGLFQVPLAGGTVSTVAEGAPFISPDSVVATAKGEAYVTDQGSGPDRGKVFRVSGGNATQVLANLRLGSPAGLTLINNDATLLVSSIDPTTGSDQVLFLDLASGKTAAATKVIGANKNSSGGLHRALHASILAWADVSRSGRVYRVDP